MMRMRHLRRSRRVVAALRTLPAALLLVTILCVGAQSSPTPDEPLFQDRPFGPYAEATPSVGHAGLYEGSRIPRFWKIGMLAAAAMLGAVLVYRSSRAWRSWNLFDREYRFPVEDEVALRLGGTKSGGHMATASLAPAAASRRLEPKDR